MVVRSAVSLAVRQTEELVLHPRRSAEHLVAGVGGMVSGVAGAVVGTGDAVVGRLISSVNPGWNPSTGETDLVQPGTEPIMDPATTKAVAAEARMMQRAADPKK